MVMSSHHFLFNEQYKIVRVSLIQKKNKIMNLRSHKQGKKEKKSGLIGTSIQVSTHQSVG
jgi:hypothetical protein